MYLEQIGFKFKLIKRLLIISKKYYQNLKEKDYKKLTIARNLYES